MTVRLDLEQARQFARELVTGREGYVYQKVSRPDLGSGCLYAFDGKPSCLVGHILHRAGVPVETLAELDGVSTASIDSLAEAGYDEEADELTASPLEAYDVEVTPNAVRFLYSLQDRQDNGHPWGYALELTEAHFRVPA